MRQTLLALLATTALVASSGAFAAPVLLQDGYVRTGVNDYGTLGSIGATSPGILFDATGTSNYGVNDFLTPGDPFEGYYIAADGGYYNGANNDGVAGFGVNAPISGSATTATWAGTDGTLDVGMSYTLTTVAGRSVIAITTTLTNVSNGTLTNVAFERITDPDPDVNAFGSFFTVNSLVSSSQACGTGTFSGQTICITTDSTDYTKQAGVTSSWSTDPYEILGGPNDGNGDYSIALAFLVGDLAAGSTATLNYYYALGASREVASGDVPEPFSAALLGFGLAGVAALRRRKKS